MAAFRYRVNTPRGLIAGFKFQDDAEEYARWVSAERGVFTFVREFPHGEGKAGIREVAHFLRGKRLQPE